MLIVTNVESWAGPWLPVMLDAALKGALLLGLAYVLTRALSRSSAALRHLVLFGAMAGLLIMPALSRLLPGWQILPNWADRASGVAVVVPAETAGAAAEAISALPGPVVEPVRSVGSVGSVRRTTLAEAAPPAAAVPAPQGALAPAAATSHGLSLRDAWPWLLVVWAVGTLFALLPLAAGQISLWLLSRSAKRMDASARTAGILACGASPWASLPETAKEDGAASWLSLLHDTCSRLGIHRRVTLLLSDRRAMPMTWGLWRARILLPQDAEMWPEERRRVVLLHELAHIKRWDCLAQTLSQIACALHWFNPLAWVVARRMVSERERACDDMVLGAGFQPADYADHLLQVASGLKSIWPGSAAAIAMARPSKLEGRLVAILDGARRRRRLTRAAALGVAVLLVGITVPLAMIRAQEKDATLPSGYEKAPLSGPDLSIKIGPNRFAVEAVARNEQDGSLLYEDGKGKVVRAQDHRPPTDALAQALGKDVVLVQMPSGINFDVIESRVFDHETRELLWDGGPASVVADRVGDSWMRLTRSGGRMPDSIDLWFRADSYPEKDQPLILKGAVGEKLAIGPSTITVREIRDGAVSVGKWDYSDLTKPPKLQWLEDNIYRKGEACTVVFDETGQWPHGRYQVCAVDKRGRKHFDDPHFMDFARNGPTQVIFYHSLPISQLDHFEWRPFGGRHVFCLDGIRLPKVAQLNVPGLVCPFTANRYMEGEKKDRVFEWNIERPVKAGIQTILWDGSYMMTSRAEMVMDEGPFLASLKVERAAEPLDQYMIFSPGGRDGQKNRQGIITTERPDVSLRIKAFDRPDVLTSDAYLCVLEGEWIRDGKTVHVMKYLVRAVPEDDIGGEILQRHENDVALRDLVPGERMPVHWMFTKNGPPSGGMVVARESGKPVKEANVCIQSYESVEKASVHRLGNEVQAVADAEGGFLLDCLKADGSRYWFNVRAEGYAPLVVGPFVAGQSMGVIALCPAIEVSGEIRAPQEQLKGLTAYGEQRLMQQDVVGAKPGSEKWVSSWSYPIGGKPVDGCLRFTIKDLREGPFDIRVNWSGDQKQQPVQVYKTDLKKSVQGLVITPEGVTETPPQVLAAKADPKAAAPMMEALAGMWKPLVEAAGRNDAQGALDILKTFIPKLEELNVNLTGTVADKPIATAIEQVRLIQKALQDGNMPQAKALLDGFNASGPGLAKAVYAAAGVTDPREQIMRTRAGSIPAEPKADLRPIVQFRLVDDTGAKNGDAMKMPVSEDTINVMQEVLLSEADVASAKAVADAGAWHVELRLTPKGAERFAEVTQKNLNRRLAIVFKGQLLSAPLIRSRIAGGVAMITARFTEQEARALAEAITQALPMAETGADAKTPPATPIVFDVLEGQLRMRSEGFDGVVTLDRNTGERTATKPPGGLEETVVTVGPGGVVAAGPNAEIRGETMVVRSSSLYLSAENARITLGSTDSNIWLEARDGKPILSAKGQMLQGTTITLDPPDKEGVFPVRVGDVEKMKLRVKDGKIEVEGAPAQSTTSPIVFDVQDGQLRMRSRIGDKVQAGDHGAVTTIAYPTTRETNDAEDPEATLIVGPRDVRMTTATGRITSSSIAWDTGGLAMVAANERITLGAPEDKVWVEVRDGKPLLSAQGQALQGTTITLDPPDKDGLVPVRLDDTEKMKLRMKDGKIEVQAVVQMPGGTQPPASPEAELRALAEKLTQAIRENDKNLAAEALGDLGLATGGMQYGHSGRWDGIWMGTAHALLISAPFGPQNGPSDEQRIVLERRGNRWQGKVVERTSARDRVHSAKFIDQCSDLDGARVLVTPPATAGPAWGEPVGGLRLRLTPVTGDTYRRNSPLWMLLELRNDSEEAIPLDRFGIYADMEDVARKLIVRRPIGLGPWAGRTDFLYPGQGIVWLDYFDRARSATPPKAGDRITVRFRMTRRAGAPPAALDTFFSNPVTITIGDPFPHDMAAEGDLPAKWDRSLDLTYRDDMGLGGWRSLRIYGDGRAVLVRPGFGKADDLVPPGRYEAVLGQERLDQIVRLLHDQRVWELAKLPADIKAPDEGGVDLCLASGAASLVAEFPHRVVRQQAALQAVQKEMQALMTEMVSKAVPEVTEAQVTIYAFDTRGRGQRQVTVTDPESLKRLLSFLPEAFSGRTSGMAAGWEADYVIEFKTKEGRTRKVTCDPNCTLYSAGKGDFEVQGDLRAFLRELGKAKALGAAAPYGTNIVLEDLDRPDFRAKMPSAKEITFAEYIKLKAKSAGRADGRFTLESFDDNHAWLADIIQSKKSKGWEWTDRYVLPRDEQVDAEFNIKGILEERAKGIGGVRYGMSVADVIALKGNSHNQIPRAEDGSSYLMFDDVKVRVRGWSPGERKGRVVGVEAINDAVAKEAIPKCVAQICDRVGRLKADYPQLSDWQSAAVTDRGLKYEKGTASWPKGKMGGTSFNVSNGCSITIAFSRADEGFTSAAMAEGGFYPKARLRYSLFLFATGAKHKEFEEAVRTIVREEADKLAATMEKGE
jgi:hypothetical protein